MVREIVWRPLKRPELGLCNTISNIIYESEWRNPDLLTSVRRGNTLFLASDYSGDYKSVHYESISFLVVDLAFYWLWNEFRQKIRKEILKDNRRISFKKLNDDRRAKALVPLLRASNTLPGLLITFLIDKGVIPQLSVGIEEGHESSVVPLSKWKRKSFEKLNRVGHLGAMLVGCMSAPRQDVIWITDEDEIAPNVTKLVEATNVIGHFLNHYCSHNMGRFQFGTTKSDNGSKEIEDLAALPDLAAGALAELLTMASDNQVLPQSQIHLPLPVCISRKTHAIVGWLADKPHPLKKLVVYVDQTSSDTYSVRLLETLLETPISEYDWRPELAEYLKDKILL
jgi:hypothetical protein